MYTISSYSFLHNMNIKVKNYGSHIVQRPGFWGYLCVAQAEISTYVHCIALSSNIHKQKLLHVTHVHMEICKILQQTNL